MDREQVDNDIVEMDFPAYAEDSSAIPDVTPENSFAENKEEIYRRNRLLAAEMQAKELAVIAEEEKAIAAKAAKFEAIYKERAAAENYSRSMKIIFSALAVLLMTVLAVAVIFLVQSGSRDNSDMDMLAEAAEVVSTAAESEKAAPAVTEVSEEEAAEVSEEEAAEVSEEEAAEVSEEEAAEVSEEEAAEVSEEEAAEVSEEEAAEVTEEEAAEEETAEVIASDLKTTVVRAPFESDGNALVYNTDVMSYRFEPHYVYNQYEQPFLLINTTVKNLTDYDYVVVPHFVMSVGDPPEGVSRNYSELYGSVSEFSTKAGFFYVEELVDGEWVKSSRRSSYHIFDEEHLCSFKIQYYLDEDDVFETFSYTPLRTPNSDVSQMSDTGFSIPYEELEKYIKE